MFAAFSLLAIVKTMAARELVRSFTHRLFGRIESQTFGMIDLTAGKESV